MIKCGFFGFQILIHAFCAMFFSSMVLWLSTKLPNIFVLASSPIILFYVLENISVGLKLPLLLSITRIGKGTVVLGNNPWITLVDSILLSGTFSVLCSIAFYHSCKRRIENALY